MLGTNRYPEGLFAWITAIYTGTILQGSQFYTLIQAAISYSS